MRIGNLVLISALLACGGTGSIEVREIVPASWMHGQRPRLHISGSGFSAHMVTDVMEVGVRVRSDYSGRLGQVELEEVEWLSNEELTARAPELEPGEYDLSIVRPDGRSATLPAAVLVHESTALGPPWAFNPPVAVEGDVNLGAGEDDDLTFGPELTTAYFASNRSGTWDIWTAPFDSRTLILGSATPVVEVSSPDYDDDDCEISSGGLMMLFVSNRPGDGDLWLAVRPDLRAPFGAPVSLGFSGDDPTISEDGRELIWDCYDVPCRATRASAAEPFGSDAVVAEIETASAEFDFFLTANGLHLFFVRESAGGADIWVATRVDAEAAFDAGVPVDGVNLPNTREREPWLSSDGTLLFFTSNRTGSELVYVSRRN